MKYLEQRVKIEETEDQQKQNKTYGGWRRGHKHQIGGNRQIESAIQDIRQSTQEGKTLKQTQESRRR